MDGILRWDTNNSTFLTPGLGSGMPANVDDEVYTMMTVGMIFGLAPTKAGHQMFHSGIVLKINGLFIRLIA